MPQSSLYHTAADGHAFAGDPGYTIPDECYALPAMWRATKREMVEVPQAVYDLALRERNHLISRYADYPIALMQRLYDRDFNTLISEIENSLDPDMSTFVASQNVRQAIVVGALTLLQRKEVAAGM